MSEAKMQTLERIIENVESDTDNEKDIDISKNNKLKKKDDNNFQRENNKGNVMVLNQSNQNFAKFSQMAKNNNQSSFSDQSISKDEKSDENDDFDLSQEKEKNMNYPHKSKEIKKKSENINTDMNNNLNNKYEYNSDSDPEGKDVSRDDPRYNNIMEREKQNLKLNFYDINQFLELDINLEYKDLVNVMKKFEVDKNILKLETKMKPFIPKFLPSIGEVDAIIKINRPDNKIEELGLETVDEPTIIGIDPSVFSLELSYKMKTKIPDNFIIKSIENAHNNAKQISNWIDNLESLHKGSSNNFVNYSKKMPEIEELMQVWPECLEIALENMNIPKEGINIDLTNYSKIICTILDIPIHQINSNNENNSLIEALHVLFSLYSEFKENKHFQNEEHKNQNVMKFQ